MDSLTTSSEFPKEVTDYFRRILLEERVSVIDEDFRIRTLYLLPEDLNGDNKGQDYGME